MTRINVGVFPKELCDQHLIAEYRELPRLWGKVSKNPAPKHFKLGSGHVLWCQQYQGMLYDKYLSIVEEMLARGFKVSFPDPPKKAYYGSRPPKEEIYRARPIVLNRINDSLFTMKRNPIWTKRKFTKKIT